jgi:hypothetical protein
MKPLMFTAVLLSSILLGCGATTPSVVLKYTTPMSKLYGPLYVQVRGSSGLVNAIRRTVAQDRNQKVAVFRVVQTVRGSKDCARTIRYPSNRSDPPLLRRFAGQRATLVMFGGRGGLDEKQFCYLPGPMAGLIP